MKISSAVRFLEMWFLTFRFSWHQPTSTLCLWNHKFNCSSFECALLLQSYVSIHAVASIWHLFFFFLLFFLPTLPTFHFPKPNSFATSRRNSLMPLSLPSFPYLKHTSIISLSPLVCNDLFTQLSSLLDSEFICDIAHILLWYPNM